MGPNAIRAERSEQETDRATEQSIMDSARRYEIDWFNLAAAKRMIENLSGV